MPERSHHRFWPKRLPHSIHTPQTSLWFNLVVSAQRYPNKPATVFFDQSLTYASCKHRPNGWLRTCMRMACRRATG